MNWRKRYSPDAGEKEILMQNCTSYLAKWTAPALINCHSRNSQFKVKKDGGEIWLTHEDVSSLD